MAWGLFKKRKKEEASGVPAATTEAPPKARGEPPLSVGNLQMLGAREEQQDAFYISALEQYEEKGLLAILCDGMGGMSEGRAIANEVLSGLREGFSPERPEETPQLISTLSKAAFNAYRGQGGTTLVLVYLFKGGLRFWSVGDSDLFLLREGRLYAVNLRHEYENQLLLRALRADRPVEHAFTHPEHGALYAYIGAQALEYDGFLEPFPLRDGDALLLCTDGVSDTLSLAQIQRALLLPPEEAAAQMEAEILSASLPGQDNATAVILRYHETEHKQKRKEKTHE